MDKKVIELAREAGFVNLADKYWDCTTAGIERFDALVEDDFKNRLAQAIEQMPFGDTATSFAVFVRNFK